MIKAGIIGATGYTGFELTKILNSHPEVEIVYLSSRTSNNVPICEIFPEFKGELNIPCESFDGQLTESLKQSDVVFLSVPHGASLKIAGNLVSENKKIIDLSADFRLKDKESYKKWYGIEHDRQDLLDKAVYGLPEFNKELIKKSNFVSNPGCFPTSILLAVLPMAKLEKTELSFVIDAKTGASGAGRKPFLPLSFCELNQDIRPYKINRHQHSIEVLQQFEKISAKKMDLFFIPHLIGIERGILSTVYIDYGDFVKTDEILKCFNQCYQDSAFVQVFDSAEKISLKDVISTNKCHIGLSVFEKESKLVICSAIDNLQKGAAGQAVQNMNLMFGFDEKAGLI